ncbi:LacI family transcriptional regulator, partial [bacterium]
MASLRDVAARAGVDVSTASKVLGAGRIRVSEATRGRIEAAARELDYTPDPYAQGLRTRRRGAIAMAVRETTNFVFPEIVTGAEDEAEARGVGLFLVKQASRDPAARLLSLMRQGRMDGWILADEPPSDDFVAEATRYGIPLVTLNRLEAGPGPWVCLDDEAGFRAQADYLVAKGHRNVAFVEVRPASFLSRLCAQSFIERVREQGGQVELVGGRFDGDDAEDVAQALLALRPCPTAVACGGTQGAARLVEA